MSAASPKPLTTIPQLPKTIQTKIQECKVLTPRQKLTVLKKTRAVLETNYLDGEWVEFIDGVEFFCLYGAMERMAGLDPEEDSDEKISQCSLTSTLYDSLPRNRARSEAQRKIKRMKDSIKMWEKDISEAERSIKGSEIRAEKIRKLLKTEKDVDRIEDFEYELEDLEVSIEEDKVLIRMSQERIEDEQAAIMAAKVTALQATNDNKGQKRIIAVVDRAIARLEEAVTAGEGG